MVNNYFEYNYQPVTLKYAKKIIKRPPRTIPGHLVKESEI